MSVCPNNLPSPYLGVAYYCVLILLLIIAYFLQRIVRTGSSSTLNELD